MKTFVDKFERTKHKNVAICKECHTAETVIVDVNRVEDQTCGAEGCDGELLVVIGSTWPRHTVKEVASCHFCPFGGRFILCVHPDTPEHLQTKKDVLPDRCPLRIRDIVIKAS